MEDFTTIRTLDLQKSYQHSGPSPRCQTNFGPAPTQRSGQGKPLVVNRGRVVVGLFKEEEERTKIISEVVKHNNKVKSEDTPPDTPPGYLSLGVDRVRRNVCNFQSWVCPPTWTHVLMNHAFHASMPKPQRFHNIGSRKQSITHLRTLERKKERK